jgi:hypothetical protein
MRLHQVILASLLPAASLASSSDAAIIAFTQQSVWQLFSSSNGTFQVTETFDNYASGAYAPALSGSAGGVAWTAAALGGIEVGTVAGSKALSTVDPVALTLTFSGTPVQGIGANVFGTDAGFAVVPIVVRVTLFDGTSIVRTMSGADSFLGVWSTGAGITSIQVLATPVAGSSAVAFPTIDNLTFAVVPAPGAFLALAAAVAAPRRRRA